MKVLILAAGIGTRINRYLSGKPKCTVDIGGKSLIRYTVEIFKNKGIEEIGVVVGFGQDYIKKELEGLNVKYYYNYFFNVTNSIASAWFAFDFIEEDMLIMNGDVFLEENLLDDIIKEEKSPVLFSDENRKEEADYKFFYKDGILKKYGKELKGKEITGEYIGVAKLKKSFIPKFKNQLKCMIENQEHSVWWENVLYSLVETQDIYIQNIKNKFWAEIDYIEDYERILNFRKFKINYNIEVVKSD
ncbi:NTP transferase domain-containing protein [Fusobacterium sp. MFO224]|uniref:phosphocholine cytidylyltransferase family protein n=1 Tax=Fusobacterium sp. MFO224 TaxID=3378070 RepID=UPI003853BE37